MKNNKNDVVYRNIKLGSLLKIIHDNTLIDIVDTGRKTLFYGKCADYSGWENYLQTYYLKECEVVEMYFVQGIDADIEALRIVILNTREEKE